MRIFILASLMAAPLFQMSPAHAVDQKLIHKVLFGSKNKNAQVADDDLAVILAAAIKQLCTGEIADRFREQLAKEQAEGFECLRSLDRNDQLKIAVPALKECALYLAVTITSGDDPGSEDALSQKVVDKTKSLIADNYRPLYTAQCSDRAATQLRLQQRSQQNSMQPSTGGTFESNGFSRSLSERPGKSY